MGNKSSILLTLPPKVGNKYVYENTHPPGWEGDSDGGVCEIVSEGEWNGETTFISHGENGDMWTFWPDGKARIKACDGKEYCAILREDVFIAPSLPESTEFKELKARKDKMMSRLKELGA